MPEQPQRAREAIAQNRRADVPDVHRLGDIWRTEINHHRAPLPRRLEDLLATARDLREHLCQRGGLEAEIEEPRAGQLDRLAPFRHVEFREHVRAELARIQLALLRHGHQRARLVIAKLRIRARADENAAELGVGQNRGDGLLQAGFEGAK